MNGEVCVYSRAVKTLECVTSQRTAENGDYILMFHGRRIGTLSPRHLSEVMRMTRTLSPCRNCSLCDEIPYEWIQQSPIQQSSSFSSRICRGEDKDCVICLEKIEIGSTTASKSCNHELHEKCGEMWFRNGRTCPVCRCSN